VCQLSIYNMFPVIRTTIAKNSHFTYPGLHFCLPGGRPCGNHAKRCMNEKTIQCLPNQSQHVPIYLQQFPSYSNHNCKKSSFLHTPPFIFCLPWGRPCNYHVICSMGGKTIQCLPNPSQHVPIYVEYFPSYTIITLSQCVSPKIAILPHFGFPWGRPWGNHAKCCMDGKMIRCLQIVLLHELIKL